MKKRSIPIDLRNPGFLISIRDDWFIFNADGDVYRSLAMRKYLYKNSSPILDIATINRSIAILTKEQILVLNVNNNFKLVILVLFFPILINCMTFPSKIQLFMIQILNI